MSKIQEKTAKNIEKKSKMFSTGKSPSKMWKKKSKYRKTGRKPQKIL